MDGLFNEIMNWPAAVRVVVVLAGWAIGLRLGSWLYDVAKDHWAMARADRAARMRNVTPR